MFMEEAMKTIGEAVKQSVRKIMAQVIANAEPKEVQEQMVLAAYQSDLIDRNQAYQLAAWYGLQVFK